MGGRWTALGSGKRKEEAPAAAVVTVMMGVTPQQGTGRGATRAGQPSRTHDRPPCAPCPHRSTRWGGSSLLPPFLPSRFPLYLQWISSNIAHATACVGRSNGPPSCLLSRFERRSSEEATRVGERDRKKCGKGLLVTAAADWTADQGRVSVRQKACVFLKARSCLFNQRPCSTPMTFASRGRHRFDLRDPSCCCWACGGKRAPGIGARFPFD